MFFVIHQIVQQELKLNLRKFRSSRIVSYSHFRGGCGQRSVFLNFRYFSKNNKKKNYKNYVKKMNVSMMRGHFAVSGAALAVGSMTREVSTPEQAQDTLVYQGLK